MSIEDVLSKIAEGAFSDPKPKQALSDPPRVSTTMGADAPKGDLAHSKVPDAKTPPPNAAAPKNLIPSGALHLPVGVRLLRQISVRPPSGQLRWHKVTDLGKFITTQLADLDARLNSPVQIRGGGSVFEILRTLADVGVELAVEPPAVEAPNGPSPISPESPRESPE